MQRPLLRARLRRDKFPIFLRTKIVVSYSAVSFTKSMLCLSTLTSLTTPILMRERAEPFKDTTRHQRASRSLRDDKNQEREERRAGETRAATEREKAEDQGAKERLTPSKIQETIVDTKTRCARAADGRMARILTIA